jgi:GntR family transcriptional regulator
MQSYMRLYQDLCSKIMAGNWQYGHKLPTEMELSASFGVSRITTRAALKMLEQQGLVERHAGRGTFVKAAKPQKLAICEKDFIGSVRSGRFNITRKLIIRKQLSAPEHIAKVLDIFRNSAVLYAERLDTQSAEPVAYDRVYIPLELADRVDDEMLARIDFADRWLTAQKLALSHSNEIIEAVAADAYSAKLLNVKRGSPMILATDVLFTASRPAGMFESIYRGDRIRLVSTVRRK